MYNNSEQCCLSCGTDISHKRIDAKYCSDRCRMRYRRKQIHDQLIEELIQLFTQLPNHSVQRFHGALLLTGPNAKGGNHQSWGSKELENMSKDQLRDLIKEKRVLLKAEKVKRWWLNRNTKSIQ